MPGRKTIVVGLGNPLLGDDGAGWKVASLLEEQEGMQNVKVEYVAEGGLRLMEIMIGYERAIIVDSIHIEDTVAGSVRTFALESLPNPFAGHLGSSHETNLQTAMQIGRLSGASLPSEVIVVAIESTNVYEFSEQLSRPVAQAVPAAAELIARLVAD
ncbi:MAG TPA: hydrogenase maturation protease [Anaerolineaceae bacterium]|nr:hydrogenase maturation protease [Anaerolineaceae bacterium]